MPTIPETITALQLKFIGHVLRGSQEVLETQVCFTSAWVYRGGLTGGGLRKGLPKLHWLDQATYKWNMGYFSESKPHRDSAAQPHCFHQRISPYTELPKIDNSGGSQQSCLHALRIIRRAHSKLSQSLYVLHLASQKTVFNALFKGQR